MRWGAMGCDGGMRGMRGMRPVRGGSRVVGGGGRVRQVVVREMRVGTRNRNRNCNRRSKKPLGCAGAQCSTLSDPFHACIHSLRVHSTYTYPALRSSAAHSVSSDRATRNSGGMRESIRANSSSQHRRNQPAYGGRWVCSVFVVCVCVCVDELGREGGRKRERMCQLHEHSVFYLQVVNIHIQSA